MIAGGTSPQGSRSLTNNTWESEGMVGLGRRWARSLATVHHRLQVVSPWPLPAQSAAILACNHISFADPLFLQAACPRLIAWMIAEEYYYRPGIHWVCSKIRAIPVDRGGHDLRATRQAMRALREGRILGVFPEGRLATGSELLPFHTGAALLAIRSGVPLVPARIEGTTRGTQTIMEAWWMPHRVTLAFGSPLDLGHDTSHEALEAATRKLRQAIELL